MGSNHPKVVICGLAFRKFHKKKPLQPEKTPPLDPFGWSPWSPWSPELGEVRDIQILWQLWLFVVLIAKACMKNVIANHRGLPLVLPLETAKRATNKHIRNVIKRSF
jgi:hypothetical protein